ncbi:hypothetical protein PG988_006535 [Apiospora saccharicola]
MNSLTDDDRFLLGQDRAAAAELFVKSLEKRTDEDIRNLCLQKLEYLLDKKLASEYEFVVYERLFTTLKPIKTLTKSDPRWLEWRQFKAAAKSGKSSADRIHGALKTMRDLWGEDIIEYYSFGEKGVGFVIKLASTANTHRDWEKAARPRLQQLIRRRIELGRGQHPLHAIQRIDLTNAISWKKDESFTKSNDPDLVPLPFKPLGKDQIPDGYELDKFGLFVVSNNLNRTGPSASPQSDNSINNIDESDTDVGSNTSDDTPNGTTGTSPLPASSETVGATLKGGANRFPATNHKTRNLAVYGSGPVGKDLAGADSAPQRRRGGRPIKVTPKGGVRTEKLEVLISELYSKASAYLVIGGTTAGPGKRRRAASLPPDVLRCAPKRHHSAFPARCPNSHSHYERPMRDCSDNAYLLLAVSEAEQRASEAPNSRGAQTARALRPVLQSCKQPNTNEKDGAIELHLLTGIEAKTLLDQMTPDVPIITKQQQQFQWQSSNRPVVEFLTEWIIGHTRKVSVQIPSLDAAECSYQLREIQEVYKRFFTNNKSDDPWNILDCSCPVPSTLPQFLTGRNCQLLGRLRDTVLNGNSAERVVARREDWVLWREIESWSLLSEGGHCTAAHMDSHGLATWITVQEGDFGFAWLSRPTNEQREEWMSDPEHFDEGQQWRYWILKPGQTIFFPSGTIHCVFRTRGSQTFALGGHIIQWSGLERWVDTIKRQDAAPDSTNEDMRDVQKWVHAMEEVVRAILEDKAY